MEQTFGISQGSISNFTNKFLKSMIDVFSILINWPTGNKVEEVCQGFSSLCSLGPCLNDVIGAVSKRRV
jgi:hypothetical protein